MAFLSLYFTALCVLIGEEDRDYVIFERDMEEWKVFGDVVRN